VPGPLEGLGDLVLVSGARTGAGAVQNFGVRRHEPAQEQDVLVVHMGNFTLAEITGLGLELNVIVHGFDCVRSGFKVPAH
jgi:hypothetical protein